MVEAADKFDVRQFLATAGPGRRIVHERKKGRFFSQGALADCVFYLQSGRGKLSVVSKRGKEATVTQLAKGDFFGEEAIADWSTERTSTASAVTPCTALEMTKSEFLSILGKETTFSTFFMNFLVVRGIRTQADLVDQLFNSSERRLARVLLLMAEYGGDGEVETLIPPITQGALAEMIGTTRSHISFIMNRFRKLGYIEYNGRIRVNKSLLDMVLHDELPEENASRPKLLDPTRTASQASRRARIV
jgi:CRP-like cAMP-binding protein